MIVFINYKIFHKFYIIFKNYLKNQNLQKNKINYLRKYIKLQSKN